MTMASSNDLVDDKYSFHQNTKHVDDPVNHPRHYNNNPSGVECIQIVRHMSFNVGNAIKYLWRVNDKGDPIENLEKAKWYIEDEINRLKEAK